MKKRALSVLLTVTMLVAMLAGCQAPANTDTTAANETKGTEAPAETDAPTEADQETESTEKVYDEKIAFTMTGYNTIAGEDYTSDVLGQYIQELFNVDITVLNNENSGAEERFNLAATSGTLANSNVVNPFRWATYYEFVDQGLYKPLPDNWEENWPNLAKMVELSGFKDYLTVDGKIYGLVHTMYGNLTEVSKVSYNVSLFFRKDWAEQVGMGDLGADGTVTLAEFEEYLTKVEAAGLVEDGKGFLGAPTAHMQRFFKWEAGVSSDDFTETSDGYVWTPTTDAYVDYLTTFQEWYKKGLVDPDFYLNNTAYYQNAFGSGLIPAMFCDGGAGNVQAALDDLIKNGEVESIDDLGYVYVEAEDGSTYGMEYYNYWLASVFSPETDDKTMERILDIVDWACTKDGQITLIYGVPGVNWEYDEEGKIKIIDEWDQSSRMAYMLLGYCSDDVFLSPYDTSTDPVIVEMVTKMYEIKSKDTFMNRARAYDLYTGDVKNTYSGEVSLSKLENNIVCDGLDVESTVNEYIQTKAEYWETLEDELNIFAESFK